MDYLQNPMSGERKFEGERLTIKTQKRETGWEEIKRQEGESLKSLTREDR